MYVYVCTPSKAGWLGVTRARVPVVYEYVYVRVSGASVYFRSKAGSLGGDKKPDSRSVD